MPYPDDATPLFYNPKGGSYYHRIADCSSVKPKYLPLAEFSYRELDSGEYAKLEPCAACTPVKRKGVIDEGNRSRGIDVPEATEAPEETQAPEAPQGAEDGGGASDSGDVIITIKGE